MEGRPVAPGQSMVVAVTGASKGPARTPGGRARGASRGPAHRSGPPVSSVRTRRASSVGTEKWVDTAPNATGATGRLYQLLVKTNLALYLSLMAPELSWGRAREPWTWRSGSAHGGVRGSGPDGAHGASSGPVPQGTRGGDVAAATAPPLVALL